MKIDDLLHERVFPHRVESLQMQETHSAWGHPDGTVRV